MNIGSTCRFLALFIGLALGWSASYPTHLLADAPKGPKKEASKKQVHLLSLRGTYVDFPRPFALNPSTALLGHVKKQKSFYRLCEHLEKVADDEKIDTIVLDLSDNTFDMNAAQSEELTRRLRVFKQAKKPLIAWLGNASRQQYSIACGCDKILMADLGAIDFPSTAMQTLFFRDLMDLLGIKASMVRAGDFKGAVEPYVRSTMSARLKTHYLRMVKTINEAYVDHVSQARGIPKQSIRDLQAQRILSPDDALKAGLVDRVIPYGTMRQTVEAMTERSVKWSEPNTKKKSRSFSLADMFSLFSGSGEKGIRKSKKPTLAILHLEGAITDDSSQSSSAVDPRKIVKEIESLIEDSAIKGVIVRINSPGGNPSACERIRCTLEKLAKKKPTVVSMGKMAASGGYWVSCIGVPIYAEKTTITGSIGVFGVKLSFGGLMRRAGIHLETVALDESAKMFSISDPWNEQQQQILDRNVKETYRRFLSLVSKHRSIPVEDIELLAGGRVWSGTQAKSLGLVDQIGGVDDCLQYLTNKTKTKKFNTVHRPIQEHGFPLLELFSGQDEGVMNRITWKFLEPILAKGFQLETTLTLLRDSLNQNRDLPSTWLMHPTEIYIR